MSKTFKNVTNDGYTTYHSDGSKSTTFQNVTDSGYTTHHDDGGKSVTYQNILIPGFTTYDIPDYQAGGLDDGGLLGNLSLIFGMTIILASVLSLFGLGKSGIFALSMIGISIIAKIILNRKFNTCFFTLWAHPLTLLGWRLLVNAMWENNDGDIFVFFGVFFLTVGVIATGLVDNSPFGMFFYQFLTVIMMVVMKAYGEYAPYWQVAVMVAIAVIATIVAVLKRSVVSQADRPIQNPQSHTVVPRVQPQTRPTPKPQAPAMAAKIPAAQPSIPSVKQQKIAEETKEEEDFDKKVRRIVAGMVREREIKEQKRLVVTKGRQRAAETEKQVSQKETEEIARVEELAKLINRQKELEAELRKRGVSIEGLSDKSAGSGK